MLGQGDLTVRFDESGKDELSHISKHLNNMIASVANVIRKIRHESDTTSTQAEALSTLSTETLTSMEDVNSSISKVTEAIASASVTVEETNASVEEFAANAQSTAKNAANGAEQASYVSSISQETVTEVESTLKKVREAQDTATTSIHNMQKLGQAVNAISSFMDTITSIADQTNLLALNAAIQAARAGDADRGFAVVAEEVRKLAEESAQSAQEVSKRMIDLKSQSSQAVTATENTEKLLVETANATQDKFQHTMEAMSLLNKAIQNIAAPSQEEAISSEEITTAIQNMTNANHEVLMSNEAIEAASQGTSHVAESIAQEAQTVATSSDALRSLVRTFTLDKEWLAKTDQLTP